MNSEFLNALGILEKEQLQRVIASGDFKTLEEEISLKEGDLYIKRLKLLSQMKELKDGYNDVKDRKDRGSERVKAALSLQIEKSQRGLDYIWRQIDRLRKLRELTEGRR